MKRLLLIVYYFPPLGGAGVSRPLALFTHLPRHGWEVDVLTVKPVLYRHYEPELLTGLDKGRIYRSGSWDPQRLLYLLGVRKVSGEQISLTDPVARQFFPDPKVGWVKSAIRLGRTLLSNNRYAAILSSSPPISTHLVGERLAEESRLPWVADFRDFWNAYPPESYFSERKLERARALQERVTRRASAVTTVNGSLAAYFRKGQIIENGVDDTLIELWNRHPTDDVLTIGVLGTLSDMYPLKPLIDLLAQWGGSKVRERHQIRILHVGYAPRDWLASQLTNLPSTVQFESLGVRTRTDTIRALNAARLFYIGIGSPCESPFSSGRIFTLLSSGRPIIAAAPDGSEIARLIRSSPGGGELFWEDKSRAFSLLEMCLPETHEGRNVSYPSRTELARYGTIRMASEFAALLDRTCG